MLERDFTVFPLYEQNDQLKMCNASYHTKATHFLQIQVYLKKAREDSMSRD